MGQYGEREGGPRNNRAAAETAAAASPPPGGRRRRGRKFLAREQVANLPDRARHGDRHFRGGGQIVLYDERPSS